MPPKNPTNSSQYFGTTLSPEAVLDEIGTTRQRKQEILNAATLTYDENAAMRAAYIVLNKISVIRMNFIREKRAG